MPYSEYQRLGSFLGIVPSIKESIDEGSASPLYKYVLGTAVTFITIPSGTPLWLAIGGTYIIGVIAENLWDLSIDFGEWLAENQGKEINAIKDILKNKNIIINNGNLLYPFTFFQDQYNPLYKYDLFFRIQTTVMECVSG